HRCSPDFAALNPRCGPPTRLPRRLHLRLAALAALLDREERTRQVEGAVDQADVGEGLWEVADELLRCRVVFLAEKADIVAQAHEALEEFFRVVAASLEDVDVDEPEAAGEEHALARWQAIDALAGFVAQDKTVDEQALLDGTDRAGDAGIGHRQKPHG